MENLTDTLALFEPITLGEMDNVSLMDRTDTKFIFRIESLSSILKQVQPYYRVLDLNGIRASRYNTLYFDTPEFRMYLDHHRRKSNRYKVRYRIYADSGLSFFEIKFKNNKGRTIKSRVKAESGQIITGRAERLLNEKTNFSAKSIVPKLWSNYSRITLVSKSSKERLTIDINLQFRNNQDEKNVNNLVIAEVKQEKFAYSPFINIMRKERTREGSISKYCFGVVLLYNQVKSNNFKVNLLTINKINGSPDYNNISAAPQPVLSEPILSTQLIQPSAT